MKPIKSAGFLLLFLVFAGRGNSGAQETPSCLAVVTSVKGNVMLKKEGRSEFSKTYWGTQLFQGDQIKTGTDSEATLTFSDNTLVRLGANGNITVLDNGNYSNLPGSDVKKVSAKMIVNMSTLISKREAKKDVGVLSGLRATETEQHIDPVLPMNTILKTNRPEFTWSAKKNYGNFIVNLYNSKGLVWTKKVSTTFLKFPENEKELLYGETYFWNVEGENLLDNDKSINNKFTILSPGRSKEILDQEALIRETFINDPDSCNLHSFLGSFYLNQGLIQDAVNEFIIISAANPDSPLPHEILGSLYSEAGNKDKAIEELQKALALSRNGKEK